MVRCLRDAFLGVLEVISLARKTGERGKVSGMSHLGRIEIEIEIEKRRKIKIKIATTRRRKKKRIKIKIAIEVILALLNAISSPLVIHSIQGKEVLPKEVLVGMARLREVFSVD